MLVSMLIGTLGSAQTQNFEGIIVFKRSTSKGKIAFETYYFAKQKLRIDSEYILDDGIQSYISIFDFDRYTNVYFTKSKNRFEEKIINGKNIESFSIDTSLTKQILGYSCTAMNISLKEGNYSIKQDQVKYLADSLTYNVPDGWYLDWIMVSHLDNRIALLLDETMKTDELGYPMTGGYKREAISIVPMKLPDNIFQY